MNEADYRERVASALSGLVPIAWMERCSRRCADPSRPTPEELAPTVAEREAVVEVLAMADDLASGDFSRRKKRDSRPSSLAALARAIVLLAPSPGGVRVLGRRWRVEGGQLVELAEGLRGG